MPSARRRARTLLALAACTAFGAAAAVGEAGAARVATRAAPVIPDSLRGFSGQLRMAVAVLPESASVSDSQQALRAPGVWSIRDSVVDGLFHFVALVPFEAKRDGRVGAYRVGRWPAERAPSRAGRSPLPTGFIEVAPELMGLAVSTHFTLGDFLTGRDQRDVWPKPLVLDLRLVDKLELIIAELRDSGVVSPRLGIMSAFRTPNVTMGGARTRAAPDSRHQYGDAADFIVDANGDGRMDDITRDGRVDLADARRLVAIVQAVEARYPELIGGIGVYRATGRAGPFVHVDTRGERARWGVQ